MAGNDYKLTLGKADGQGELILTSDRDDIDPKDEYVYATAVDGNWIIYNTEHTYMYDYEYATLLSASESFASLKPKSITAAHRVDVEKGGVCLFAGHHFFAKNETFTDHEISVADKFPIGGEAGVSSCIIFEPNSWEFTYYSGGKTHTRIVNPGKYDDIQQTGVPTDTLVSIRRIEVES